MAVSEVLATVVTQGDPRAATLAQVERQVAHWVCAAFRLVLDDMASREAWGHLDQYLGISLRKHMGGVVERLQCEARVLEALLHAARLTESSRVAQVEVHRKLVAFRHQYLRTETTLDFFADALNTRTSPRIGALLRACDSLAHRSMAQVLDPLGKSTPVALTYLEQGLGAAILKAGLRLWDGGDVCPVAAIKITRHNLLRPTALIHEAGHQVAHITRWNDELRTTLLEGLQQAGAPRELATIWASWCSEIAADAFAFAHTGFASIAALHDVLAGTPATVFGYIVGDPHPISYLRVLLGVEFCRYFYGSGPWDTLALSWTDVYRIERVPAEVRGIAQESQPLLKAVVQLTLDTPMRAFGGRALRTIVQPERVSPAALAEMDARIGPALFTSAHWLWSEPLRILALTGLRLAAQPRNLKPILEQQEQALLRLGGALQST